MCFYFPHCSQPNAFESVLFFWFFYDVFLFCLLFLFFCFSIVVEWCQWRPFPVKAHIPIKGNSNSFEETSNLVIPCVSYPKDWCPMLLWCWIGCFATLSCELYRRFLPILMFCILQSLQNIHVGQLRIISSSPFSMACVGPSIICLYIYISPPFKCSMFQTYKILKPLQGGNENATGVRHSSRLEFQEERLCRKGNQTCTALVLPVPHGTCVAM